MTEAAPIPPRDADGVAGRSVLTVSGFTLVSRITGLARDVVTARVFGDTAVGSAFAAAFAIPNLFRRLFGEGALSAAFLPEYTRAADQDPREAGAFASLTLTLLALVTAGLTLLLELALLAGLLAAPRDPARDLSLGLMMAMLPFMPLICAAAILGGMLQAHGRFAPLAAAPVLLNGCMLAVGLPALLVPGVPITTWAYLIAAATVLSGALQVAWCLLQLRGRVSWTRAWSSARPRTAAMLRRLGPVLIGLGTLQINATLDTVIAMWPTWFGPTLAGRPFPLDQASNSILFYAQRLYQFPLGVFGIAVATVAFPALSRHAGTDRFIAVVRRGLALSLFITLPAAVGLVLVRHDLITVVYSGPGGGFSDDGLARATAVLLGYAWAIWAYSINQVLTRAHYAAGDTITPMRIALAMVAINLALNLALIWWWREAGLAWSTSIAATLQTGALWLSARRRFSPDGLLDLATRRSLVRSTLLALAMGAVVWGVTLAVPEPQAWSGHLARLALACVAGIAVYAAASAAARAPELAALLRRDG